MFRDFGGRRGYLHLGMKNASRFLFALFALSLVAAACGGSGSSDDQALIDAVAASIGDDVDMPPGVDVDCMAAAMVNGLGGAEGLESNYGITLEQIEGGADFDQDLELSRDDAMSLTDDMWECDLDEAMVAEIAADMDEDSARCLVGELDQDLLKTMMAAELMNDADGAAATAEAESQLLPAMFEAISECDIPLDQLGG